MDDVEFDFLFWGLICFEGMEIDCLLNCNLRVLCEGYLEVLGGFFVDLWYGCVVVWVDYLFIWILVYLDVVFVSYLICRFGNVFWKVFGL